MKHIKIILHNPDNQIIGYSYLSASTGLQVAAFSAWKPTVNAAMTMVKKIAAINGSADNSVR